MVKIVVPAELDEPISRDCDDDKVIAAAIAAEADLIVSGDLDLLVLGAHRGIAIMTVADVLILLGRRSPPSQTQP
ncbi:MAG: hypothetical protein RL367_1299 [Pseudomonadota bacterium]